MKKVFLISGKLQSGKNQFAEYLNQKYQLNNISVRNDLFARSVKDGCKEDFKPIVDYINRKSKMLTEELKAHKTYLEKRYPTNKKHTSEPLEDLIYFAESLQIKDENFYEDKTELTRMMLQVYGTDIFRKKVDPNYWVKQVINRIKESEEDVTIVTDVRFKNEIELLDEDSDLEVIVIRVERDIKRDGKINEHESETALDDYKNWNYIVDNNGSLEDLWYGCESIYNEVEGKLEEIK